MAPLAFWILLLVRDGYLSNDSSAMLGEYGAVKEAPATGRQSLLVLTQRFRTRSEQPDRFRPFAASAHPA